ncbi:MAG: recombinase family protein [Dysosmobacter sp.]
MVRDALDGKIDLIVTKSVSRFARNTVDSLVTVRKLKEKGVEVYFEKENIYDPGQQGGELLITIMSSLAQEESRSISENVTWGQRKRFADGKVSLPYSHFLGYRKGDNGLPEIVPEEAETVRWIYSLFLSGKTTGSIASLLTREGIPTPPARKWAASTVESILKNEKYKGDALLQKAFTVDFLTKKQKKNEGEVPQYYVENSHPAIIDPAEWKLAQRELERRKAIGRSYSGNSIFSSRLVCGDCGGYFGSKVWHSTDKYRRTIWRCNSKFTGEEKCQTPHLTEEEIKARFLDALQCAGSGQRAAAGRVPHHAGGAHRYRLPGQRDSGAPFRNGGGGRANQAVHRGEFHHGAGPGRLPGTLQRPGRAVRNRRAPSWRSSRRQRLSGKPNSRTSAVLCSSWRSTRFHHRVR